MATNITSKKLKGFPIWARQVVIWAIRGLRNSFPYLFIIIVIFSIVYLDDSITNGKEQDIRWNGLLLQIIGFVIVLRQLNARLRLFRKPSFLLRMKDFFEDFPSIHNKIFNVSVDPITLTVNISKPEVNIDLDSDAPVEKRIKVLEGEIRNVKQRLRETETSLSNHKAESKGALVEVRQQIDSSHNEIKQLMDEAVVGGINLEWVGIVYFILGIVLATTSPEISYYLGYAELCNIPAQ